MLTTKSTILRATTFAAVAALMTAPAMAQDLEIGTDLGVSGDSGIEVSEDGVNIGVDADAGAGVNASADDEDSDSEADAGVNADIGADLDAGVETDETQMADGTHTYGEVVSDINAGFDAELSDADDGIDLDFVLMSELEGNAASHAEALNDTMQSRSEVIGEVQADFQTNAWLMAELDDEGFTLDQVVWVEEEANGDLDVFIDDRA